MRNSSTRRLARRIAGTFVSLTALLLSATTFGETLSNLEITHRIANTVRADHQYAHALEITIANNGDTDLADLTVDFGMTEPPSRNASSRALPRVVALRSGQTVTFSQTVSLPLELPHGHPLFVSARAENARTHEVVERALVSYPTEAALQRAARASGQALEATSSVVLPGIAAAGVQTELVSQLSPPVSSRDPNDESSHSAISADGRFVAFESIASNFLPGDTNRKRDIYLRDRSTGATTRVSVDSAGAQANDDSFYPSISADGRYVAFSSVATNLVAGDTNAQGDVFRHDRLTRTTIRVSVGSGGSQGNEYSGSQTSISADGRKIAFGSNASNLVPGDTNGIADVFVHDSNSSTTTLVSVDSAGVQANDYSFSPSISANGQFVAFVSAASNLVPAYTAQSQQIFVRDLAARKTTMESVSSTEEQPLEFYGSQHASISADGRFVVFVSSAPNLSPGDNNGFGDVFVRDRKAGTTTLVTLGPANRQANDGSFEPSISSDGRYVAYHSWASNLVDGDTNGSTACCGGADVFLRDRALGQTTRVSLGGANTQSNDDSYAGSITPSGRYVVFLSRGRNLVSGDTNERTDVFVRDRSTNTTSRIDAPAHVVYAANADSGLGERSISADGRFVAFESFATNLLPSGSPQPPQVFVRDRVLGKTTLASVNHLGVRGNSYSSNPTINANGRYLAFSSPATNFVAGDTNASLDIFARDLVSGATSRVSVSSSSVQGNAHSLSPSMDASGRYVAFQSAATNLVAADTNSAPDIFVRDRVAHTTTRVNVSSQGAQANGSSSYPSISADGRFVAFSSTAFSLVAADTNNRGDIFVHDRLTAITSRVSVSTSGVQGNEESLAPSLSADGRYVAFHSYASNLVAGDTNGEPDVFVRDRVTGVTSRVSVATGGLQAQGPAGLGGSFTPSISSDGRYVVFHSAATNLAPNDTNGFHEIFVRDRLAGTTTRVTVGADGAPTDGGSFEPQISANGAFVAYSSDATMLAPSTPSFERFRDIFISRVPPTN